MPWAAPKLFTTCLEKTFKKLKWRGKGIEIEDEHLNNLRFVDSTVLFSESANELQVNLNEMNRKKSKVIFNSRIQFEQIHAQGESFEVVDEYIFLGTLIQINTPGGEQHGKRTDQTGRQMEKWQGQWQCLIFRRRTTDGQRK
ncbi:uncharacterized protein LOC119595640 [Penaeus monodon]|uniref:uncharacterized protein LOC119595640 n=1 Tax=Penaeus monodon TaxID=6687 RepID=UPI0018A6D74C|nr:uncharacterized protein LOC119595640 [Penaeus monodon]